MFVVHVSPRVSSAGDGMRRLLVVGLPLNKAPLAFPTHVGGGDRHSAGPGLLLMMNGSGGKIQDRFLGASGACRSLAELCCPTGHRSVGLWVVSGCWSLCLNTGQPHHSAGPDGSSAPVVGASLSGGSPAERSATAPPPLHRGGYRPDATKVPSLGRDRSWGHSTFAAQRSLLRSSIILRRVRCAFRRRHLRFRFHWRSLKSVPASRHMFVDTRRDETGRVM